MLFLSLCRSKFLTYIIFLFFFEHCLQNKRSTGLFNVDIGIGRYQIIYGISNVEMETISNQVKLSYTIWWLIIFCTNLFFVVLQQHENWKEIISEVCFAYYTKCWLWYTSIIRFQILMISSKQSDDAWNSKMNEGK